LQQNQSDLIGRLFQQTGFWGVVRQNRFSRREWLEAIRRAPSIKDDFYTILSEHDRTAEVEKSSRKTQTCAAALFEMRNAECFVRR
jgi:glycerol-1-phosphate dehydrogenase [NAD(P)+]